MPGKISHPTSISYLLSWICFCTIFTGSRQPLCSPSAPHLWRGLVAGLPIPSSVGIESGGSLDSASVLLPSGSTMASSSLVSTGASQSSSSIGLPCPSGSVSRPPTSTSGLHSSGYALSLRHSGSIGLPPPPSSVYTSVASGYALALRILNFTLALWLSVTASGSITTCSATVGQLHGVSAHSSTMAPLSVGSSMGHHRDCGLSPASLLLLQASPVSVLPPPSVWSTLDSVSRPPPGCLSSAWTSSSDICLPFCQPFAIPCHHPTSTPLSFS